MFDDLRNEGNASPLFQQDDEPDPLLDAPSKKKKSGSGFQFKLKFGRKFLGMTAIQRFALAFAILVMVSVVSLALLLITNKILIF